MKIEGFVIIRADGAGDDLDTRLADFERKTGMVTLRIPAKARYDFAIHGGGQAAESKCGFDKPAAPVEAIGHAIEAGGDDE